MADGNKASNAGDADQASHPKLFISYSHTTPDHISWVVKLAEDLCEKGVDVILDQWELKRGNDTDGFMERMVTNPEIKKVALICDKVYVTKADGRLGGVGTETQIITKKIYESQVQDKFVAVVIERDDEGKVYTPAYFGSRMYIDFSVPGEATESFEQLLRWIYDKPKYKKPALGKMPTFFLSEEDTVVLATSTLFRRAKEAIRNHPDQAIPATVEYFRCLASQIEKFRIAEYTGPYDDALIQSIDVFIPYRDEAIQVFLALASCRDTPDACVAVHRFFEQLIPYLDRPDYMPGYRDPTLDNFRFIIHELFLYAAACFISRERFESAAYLMDNEYYVSGRSENGREPMQPFGVFREPLRSLKERNDRLQLGRLSLHADLLSKRCLGLDVKFRDIMQADFILFLRPHLAGNEYLRYWYPETLLYANRFAGAFKIFARSRSARYYEKIKPLLGIDSKSALEQAITKMEEDPVKFIPRWEFDTFSPVQLSGVKEIATQP